MPKLQLVLDDGIAVDLGWHDAPELYAHVLGEAAGLRCLHLQSSSTVALVAAWAVRDMLTTPMLLANTVRVSFETAREATRFLFDVAFACHEYGVGGRVEVRP